MTQVICPICRDVFEFKHPHSGYGCGRCGGHYHVYTTISGMTVIITDRNKETEFDFVHWRSHDELNELNRKLAAAIKSHPLYAKINWKKDGF